MKMIKLLSALVAVVFAGSIHLAAAPIGVVVNSSRLTVNLTVTTNSPMKTVGNLRTMTIHTTKITTGTLLNSFATWNGTNFPAGAYLVVGWDVSWYGDVLVVDNTGTNVLFDATHWDNSANQFCAIDFNFQSGGGNYAFVGTDPGYEASVNLNMTTFQFLERDSTTDIGVGSLCAGPSTERLRENRAGKLTTWTDSETATVYGAVNTFKGRSHTVVNGAIIAVGKGRGRFPYDL